MSVDPFYPTPKDTSMHYSESQGSPFLPPQLGMEEYGGLLPFPHKKRRSNSSLSSYLTNYPNSLSPSSPTHLALAIEPNVEPGIDRSAVHSFHSNPSTNSESSIFPTMDFDSIAEMANQLMTAPLDSGISTSYSTSPENPNTVAQPSSLQKIDITRKSCSPEQQHDYPLPGSPNLGVNEKSVPPPSSSADSNTYAAPNRSPEDEYDGNSGHFPDQRDFEYSKSKSKSSPSDDRPRSRLTRDQMNALKCVYSLTYFPDKATKERLAHDLDIPVRTIQIWFQNQRQYHRIKLKKRASQHHIHKPTQWQLSPSLGHPQADHQKHMSSVSSIHQQALMSAVMAGSSPGNPQQHQFMNTSRRNSAPPNYFQFNDQQESIDQNSPAGYQPLRRASMMATSTQSPGPMHGQLMPTVPEGLIPSPGLHYPDYAQQQQQQQQQQNYNEMPFNMLLNMNPNQTPGEDLKQGNGHSYNDWSQHSFSMGSFNSHGNGAYPVSNITEAYDLPQQQSEPALNSPWINPGSRSHTYSNMLF